jgi:hypothetical protein
VVTKKKDDVNLKGILNSLEETTEETSKNTKDSMNNDSKGSTNNSTLDDIKNNTKIPNKFLLKKKVDDKKDKKAFNVYMYPDLIKKLDKISQKSGWSRNEIVNMMCEYCSDNVELIEE